MADLTNPLKLMRLAVAGAAVAGLVILLSVPSGDGGLYESVVWRALVFYGFTACAYGLLPLVRRGDIAAVAMWLVLGVGVAPCFVGQELSAPHMFADMAGVILATAPIYIARYRQVAQGDTRRLRRRGGEAAHAQGDVSVHAGWQAKPETP